MKGQSAAERYRAAIALGVDFVELDVRKTRDRVSIVCHDDRTASGRRIQDLLYRELTDELGGEALTLEEMLDVAGGRVGLHIDLKETGYEAELVHTVLDRTPIDRLVITSGDEVIRTIKRQFPDLRAGLSLGDELAGAPPWVRLRARFGEAFPHRRVERSGADFVAVHRQLADFNVLRYCDRHGLPAWVWTVNEEPAIARYLADSRVTAIITDRPDLAMRIRTGRA